MSVRSIDPRWMELTSILLVRMFFLWLLAFCSILMPAGNLTYYAFWVLAFILTIPYSLWLRSRLRSIAFTSSQFMADLLLVTGIVYFTGGIHSHLTLLYPLVILSAGIAGTPREAAGTTILSIMIYMLLMALLSTGILVEYIPPNTSLQNPSITTLILRGITFAGFGVASILISRLCNLRSSQEHALADTTATLLQNIPVPALLLDPAGRILAANSPVCTLLNSAEELLCTTDYLSLCDDNADPLPDAYGSTAFLLDAKGNSIPVVYSSNDFDLPATSLYRVTLITFSDISDLISSNKQLEHMERIHSANRLAEEMAHDIRTPLTTLCASVQLLKHYEEKLTASDWLPNSPRRRDRTEVLEHLEEASGRMDTAIQNFIDFTEFSPADLISIIKLDSVHVNEG